MVNFGSDFSKSPLSDLLYENDLKVCQYSMYMLEVFTKHPPEKLEYWRKYRLENAVRCREQRSQWREANRERIRLCARRSYYRKLLREDRCDACHTQAIVMNLDNQIASILSRKSQ